MKFLTNEKIDLSFELAQMHSNAAGAIVLFSGEVRDLNAGKEVVYLEYEAHEALAEKALAKITEEARKKWDLLNIIVKHRLGRVNLTESAVVIITSTRHRREAYESNRWIIDQIKHRVPIWKKEVYFDDSFEWVLQCNHDDGEVHQSH